MQSDGSHGLDRGERWPMQLECSAQEDGEIMSEEFT